VADVFTRLGFAYKEQQGVFEVQPPAERLDIMLSEDLIEEVGRIVGYDAVPAVALPPATSAPTINAHFAAAEAAREELVVQGYSEVFTSVFAEAGERMVLNKIDSVRPYLRSTLVPGLTDALQKNKPNKELLGLSEIKLFEIGTVWKDGEEQVLLGTISEKESAKERLLLPLEVKKYQTLPLSAAIRFESFSKYPYMVRDIAVWVPTDTDAEALRSTLQTEAGELAVEVRLFDRFPKEGKVSLAFRIIFQSSKRTLTELEVTERMAVIGAFLVEKGFEIR
jgi:phenylalanyl-tRNA synthetase beta subunit